jgi:hypothetical protein
MKFHELVLILLILLFFQNAEATRRAALIFVPGYYGSTLIEENSNKEVFLNLKSIFFNRYSLRLDPDLKSRNPLKVGGIFESLSVVPGVFSIDAYGEVVTLLKKQSKKNQLEFLTFPYDWRLDPITILRQFDQQLSNWNFDINQDQITIVAHSMGAWLMSYWLRYGSQPPETAEQDLLRLKKIKRVLLVAAPFRGTLTIFRNSFYGAPGLPNDKYLGPDKISNFPSTYYLTPNEGKFVNLKGEFVTIPLKDPDQWEINNWGAFQFSKGFKVKEFVTFHLNQSKLFQEKLHAPLSLESQSEFKSLPLKVQVYVGVGKPTNDIGVILLNQDNAGVRNPAGLPFVFTTKQMKQVGLKSFLNTDVDGDQTIATESAISPSYLIESGLGEVLFRTKEHLEILKDPSSVDWDKFFNL